MFKSIDTPLIKACSILFVLISNASPELMKNVAFLPLSIEPKILSIPRILALFNVIVTFCPSSTLAVVTVTVPSLLSSVALNDAPQLNALVAIALIVGVDRLLDMFRTALNVAGDLVITKIVDRFS